MICKYRFLDLIYNVNFKKVLKSENQHSYT
jgi:hypothetical protein